MALDAANGSSKKRLRAFSIKFLRCDNRMLFPPQFSQINRMRSMPIRANWWDDCANAVDLQQIRCPC